MLPIFFQTCFESIHRLKYVLWKYYLKNFFVSNKFIFCYISILSKVSEIVEITRTLKHQTLLHPQNTLTCIYAVRDTYSIYRLMFRFIHFKCNLQTYRYTVVPTSITRSLTRKLGNKWHNHKIHFSMTQRAIISKIRWFWQVPLWPLPGLWLFFPPRYLGTKTDINVGVVICRWREGWRGEGRCNSYVCRSHIYICVLLFSPPNDGFFHKRVRLRLYHMRYICLVKYTIS